MEWLSSSFAEWVETTPLHTVGLHDTLAAFCVDEKRESPSSTDLFLPANYLGDLDRLTVLMVGTTFGRHMASHLPSLGSGKKKFKKKFKKLYSVVLLHWYSYKLNIKVSIYVNNYVKDNIKGYIKV